MHIIKTLAALAVLEDIVNGTIGRERVFRDREDLLAHDDNWLISRFEGNPPVQIKCAWIHTCAHIDTSVYVYAFIQSDLQVGR